MGEELNRREDAPSRRSERWRSLAMFVGFCCLLAWQQAADHVVLIGDTAVHNASGWVCATFLIAAIVVLVCEKGFTGSGDARVALLAPASGIAMSMLGVAQLLLSAPVARLVCFCMQAALFIVLAAGWIGRLIFGGRGVSVAFAAVAGMCSILFSYVWRSSASPVLTIAMSCLPAVSGACFIAASRLENGGAGDGDQPASDDTNHRSASSATWRAPRAALIALCLCTFAASFFCGLANDPYLVNSHRVGSWTLAISETTMLIVAIVAGVHARRMRGVQDALDGGRSNDLFVLWLTSIFAFMLVFGLLFFSVLLPNTLIIALGTISAVDSCLLVLCWVVFTWAIGGPTGSVRHRVPSSVMLMLASGMFYGHYLGAWVNRVTGISYSALGVVAVVIVAIVGLACVVDVMLYVRRASHIVQIPGPAPAAGESEQQPIVEKTVIEHLTVEQMRERLHAHRVVAMEGYSLTAREQEIVEMLLEGATVASIADKLCISERTVKFHCSNAYAKIGVHGKSELMEKFADA